MAVDNKNREEQNLERYGVWVKTGPDSINRHDSGTLDLMDIEDSDQDELLITEEEEKLLGELEESSLPDFGDFDDSFEDSFSEDFDDKHSGLSDESTGMLHKIENEISLLRNEIRQLKDELTGLRLPAVSQQNADSSDGGGFFNDEEEDETIALTGDELDNILDSADMTEESFDGNSADSINLDLSSATGLDDLSEFGDEPEVDDFSLPGDETESVDSGFEDDIEETISFDEEEIIDLSGDFTEIGFDDDEEFDAVVDSDPAMAILGSPDEPMDSGDPETIEMYIPGSSETADLEETDHEDISIVSIDDISGGDGFEDVTDLEDFGLDGTAVLEMPLMDDAEDMIQEPGDFFDDDDHGVSDVFDDGEEVDIDLTDFDDNLDSINETEILDVELEDIPLDEFGMAEDEDSDVLSDMMESPAGSDEDGFETVENIDLEEGLADGIDDEERSLISDDSDSDDEVELEDLEADDLFSMDEPEELDVVEDLVIEEIDLGSDIGEALSDADDPEEFGELTESDDSYLDHEDDDLKEITLDIGDMVPDDTGDGISEMDSLDEFHLEELDIEDDNVSNMSNPLDAETSLDEFPKISLDEEISEIETVEEFSLDDDEELEDLEIEFDEQQEGLQVTLPDDDFNELPGTEEVDLNSLEALASAPDLTEEEFADFAELPDDFDEEMKESDFASTDFREKSRTALELSSLPGDLKDEIKEVLKYMDQLLESLPEEKIQEFARSEHFEVYKRIFDDLGISEDGSS